eukprot:gene9410-12673_t
MKSNKFNPTNKRKRGKQMVIDEVGDIVVLTKCCICGGGDDDDLVILCDNEACKNETHMYCLSPPLFEVPINDWYCSECDQVGSTKDLISYFTEFEQLKSISKSNHCSYKDWITQLQQTRMNLEDWNPFSDPSKFLTEFEVGSIELIGSLVRVFIQNSECFQTGRIIDRRVDDGIWIHLILFRSGADGRNKSFSRWVDLEEHSCIISSDIIWAKLPDRSWAPALSSFRTSIELAREYYYNKSHNNNNNSNNNKISKVGRLMPIIKCKYLQSFEPAPHICFIFGDDAFYEFLDNSRGYKLSSFDSISMETRSTIGK